MSDRENNAVEEFATWLRQMKLLGGDLSLRELERRTQAAGTRVARSTIQDALDARRLPSIDHAVAMVRAMTGDEAAVDECRRRWRTARSAVRGWVLSEMPAPATARPSPQHSPSEAAAPPPVSPPPGRQPGAIWWRSRTVVVVFVAVLALGGAGIYALTTHGSGPRGHSPRQHASAAPYTPVYTHRNLSLRDYNDYFDLIAGTVVTREGAWTLSTNAGGDSHGAFELQPMTDAYLAGRTVPTVTQCAAGLARRATRTVRFPAVPPGSSFCLRNRPTGDIAIVEVNDLDHGNWGADVFLSYYRHTTAASVPTGTGSIRAQR